MRRRRLFVITAEKMETYTVRQEPPQFQAYCEKCDQGIRCLTVDQAVTITGLSARKVFRLVEAGEIHYCETDQGHLLICPNSVASFVGVGFLEQSAG